LTNRASGEKQVTFADTKEIMSGTVNGDKTKSITVSQFNINDMKGIPIT
jgi:hypothetical protein